MIPLLRKLLKKLLRDEMFARRWLRAALMALATGGLAFSDQLSRELSWPRGAHWIKVAAVVAGGVSVLINLGEKNAAPAPEPPK